MRADAQSTVLPRGTRTLERSNNHSRLHGPLPRRGSCSSKNSMRIAVSTAGLLIVSTLVACGVPAGGADASIEVTGDAGVDAGGAVDAGSMMFDAGALVDAGASDASVIVVSIDFAETSAAFPPTVNKIGFNSFWNSTSNDGDYDAWTIRRSARYRAPMISGLLEPKQLTQLPNPGPNVQADLYEEFNSELTAVDLDAQQSSLWSPGFTSPLFFADAGVVWARRPSDSDLLAIRAIAKSAGLITFLQIAGTPGTPSSIPSTTRFTGLFNLEGAPTTGGNWYPLPVAAEYPMLAHAFGSLPDALGYSEPTMYAFWQEPSHTLDESIGARVSVDRYTNFYAALGSEFLAQCRWQHCPLVGAQLNANDGDGPHDGQRYKWFVDGVKAASVDAGVALPLDALTVQNYAAQWDDNIMANTRVALGNSFPWTPVLMNEWDYCVNTRAGDGCTAALSSFSERYEGTKALAALDWLVDSIDRPDVSHVLLREKVLQEKDRTAGTTFFPWTQVPILFLASMSEFRRPATTGLATVPIVASGDADQVRILLWNKGAQTRRFSLSLRNLDPALVDQTLFVKKISKALRDVACPAPADVMDANHTITCWQDAVAPVSFAGGLLATEPFDLAPGEAAMVFAGTPPVYASTSFADHFVRAAVLVKRDGSEAAPLGQSHFDPRTGSVTLGVRSGGLAAARVTLKNLAGDTLTLSTRVASMGAASSTLVAGVRIDYLDTNHRVAKSVFFRDARWAVATADWAAFEWPPLPVPSEVVTPLANGDVTLDLAAPAPPGWSQVRDVMVGVVLAGATADTTYRVDLP